MKIPKLKVPKVDPKGAAEGIGYALVVAGLACLGVFLGGPLLGAALGLVVAGGVLVLAGNV